jgi:hypothetical protein
MYISQPSVSSLRGLSISWKPGGKKFLDCYAIASTIHLGDEQGQGQTQM